MSIFSRRQKPNSYPVAGRYPDVDINIYGKTVNGRVIIDYEKLRLDNPLLYEEILARELEAELHDPYEIDNDI